MTSNLLAKQNVGDPTGKIPILGQNLLSWGSLEKLFSRSNQALKNVTLTIIILFFLSLEITKTLTWTYIFFHPVQLKCNPFILNVPDFF